MMDGIEATDNFDTTRLGEADFWFSPLSLPQYDLLVAEGHITQDEADRYRREREESGLPMSPKDLQVQPAPEFEWLYRAGGPSIGGQYEKVEIEGLTFIALTLGDRGQIHCNPDIPKPDGYLDWEIRKPYQEGVVGVRWEATCKLSDDVYARVSGNATTVADAVIALRKQTFQPEQRYGLDWYPNEGGWIAIGSWQNTAITVKPHWDEKGKPDAFSWNVSIKEGNPLRGLADLMESYGKALQGEADSREAAMLAAIDAPNKALILAAQIVGDQAFEAGRQAGRRELKSEIFAL